MTERNEAAERLREAGKRADNWNAQHPDEATRHVGRLADAVHAAIDPSHNRADWRVQQEPAYLLRVDKADGRLDSLSRAEFNDLLDAALAAEYERGAEDGRVSATVGMLDAQQQVADATRRATVEAIRQQMQERGLVEDASNEINAMLTILDAVQQ